jgi:pimeloyl-ACP methyl ester carboxylesterase
MEFQFADFDTAHFRAGPRRTSLGPWTVEEHSFGAPGTTDKAPLVFIGGAFQNAWSFLREVRHFIGQRPVILVDLPGQGQNNQLSGDLRFTDLADLLRAFFDHHGVQTIIPVGLSYGSAIAFAFARQYPERVDRLILGGTTESIRPRVAQALGASFWYLDQGRTDLFADAVIHHLLNLPHRAATRLGDRVVEGMRVGMLELTDVERLRYRENSTRLFNDSLSGDLTCRTMVFTARYDHFTAPFEAFGVSQRCRNPEFVMIENGDHLAPVEVPKTVLALYDAFLNDKPLSAVPGVVAGAAAAEATRERRLLERRPGRRREVFLRGQNGVQSRASLLDYNAHGCLIELVDDLPSTEDDAPLNVSIPSIGANGDAVVQLDTRGARAIFLTDAFGTLGKMPVGTVEMAIPGEARPMGRRVSIAERLAAIPD